MLAAHLLHGYLGLLTLGAQAAEAALLQAVVVRHMTNQLALYSNIRVAYEPSAHRVHVKMPTLCRLRFLFNQASWRLTAVSNLL